MSAEVPPMSSVTTSSKPDSFAAQMPPIRPATGPDISRLTGRSAAASMPVMPPEDCISWTLRCRPASRIASSKRIRYFETFGPT